MRSLISSVSYRLPVYRSTNNGASWTYLSNIDASEGARNARALGAGFLGAG